AATGRRIDDDRVIAARDDRTEIAILKIVCANDVEATLPHLIERRRDLHSINLAGVEEASRVFVETEHRGTAVFRDVTANAFEENGAVVEGVREDVNFRVGKVDELPVHPYFFDFFEGHERAAAMTARPF